MKTYQIIRDIVFFLLLVAILIVGICCLSCCKHSNRGMIGGKYDVMHQFDEEFKPGRWEFIDSDHLISDDEYQRFLEEERPSRHPHERVNPEPNPAPVVESENTVDEEVVTQE